MSKISERLTKLGQIERSGFGFGARATSTKVPVILIGMSIKKASDAANVNADLFILGADVFSTINKWHKWKEILNYCHLVLVDRTSVESDINNMPNEVKIFFNDNVTNDINDLMKNDQGKIYPIQMSMFDESSSQIRDRLKKNLDIKDLIPKPIHDYILQNSLYNLPGHNK